MKPDIEIFNFTKWSRENISKDPPKLKIGDNVIFTLITKINHVGQDCDGTILYSADMINHGWDESCFEKIN